MSIEEKKKCYISGKITGLTIEEARENFREASLHARFLGYEPVNPMNIVSDTEEPKSEKDKWSWYMKADLKEMMDCDAILMQDNWEDSKGAIIEHNLAKDLGYVILYKGRHQKTEIDLSKKYSRENILSHKKDDEKTFKFLFYLICMIVFLYFINYLFDYLIK
jgi:hypothetical protein